MPKKLLIFLIVFIVLVGVATFFLLYRNKLGLFSNNTASNKQTAESLKKVAAVEKQGDFFIIRGRMSSPFKYDEKREYLIGTFVINGDPKNTEVTVTLSSIAANKSVSLAEYTENFAGVPKVGLSTLDEIKDTIRSGDPVEFRLNSNIQSYTKRAPNKHELAIIETLQEIIKGNWGDLTPPKFSIFAVSVGIIKK